MVDWPQTSSGIQGIGSLPREWQEPTDWRMPRGSDESIEAEQARIAREQWAKALSKDTGRFKYEYKPDPTWGDVGNELTSNVKGYGPKQEFEHSLFAGMPQYRPRAPLGHTSASRWALENQQPYEKSREDYLSARKGYLSEHPVTGEMMRAAGIFSQLPAGWTPFIAASGVGGFNAQPSSASLKDKLTSGAIDAGMAAAYPIGGKAINLAAPYTSKYSKEIMGRIKSAP